MRIILIEDDHEQATHIAKWLQEIFPASKIEYLATEHEFHTRAPTFIENPPDLFVIDVMLRWSDINQEPPVDVNKNGPYRAGFRCANLLLEHPKTHNIPIIISSMLAFEDVRFDFVGMPQTVKWAAKEGGKEELAQAAL